jgi:hypothetical protein
MIKKIINLLLLTAIMQQVIGQTETFGNITFTPPKDWTRGIKEGVVTYSIVNTVNGTFCVVSVFATTVSSGDAQKDFINEWKERVVIPYKGMANPKTETQTGEDGWKAVAGASAVQLDSLQFYALLNVFSGFGKKISVLTTFNDQAYLSEVDSLLQNVKLDKTASVSNPVNTNNGTVKSNARSSIIGTWSSTNVSIANYVNSSGGYIGDASISTMEEYTFKDGNTYIYKFFGSTGGKIYYTETTGTFKIEDRNLTLTPGKRKGGYGGNIQDEKHLLDKPVTFDCYIGPNKWEAGPFLNLHKDGNYYMWSDYPYDYYKKIVDSSNSLSQNKANSNAGPSVVGIWSSSTKPIINSVISQAAFVGSSDTQTFEEYEFKADNMYVYKYFNRSNIGKLYYSETTGTFKMNGRNLILTPVKRRGGPIGGRGESVVIKTENDLYRIIKDENKLLGKPVTFDCFIGPNKWEAGPFLNLHKDGNYYINTDFQYDFYKRLK